MYVYMFMCVSLSWRGGEQFSEIHLSVSAALFSNWAFVEILLWLLNSQT